MKTKLLIAILLLGYKMSFAQTTPSYLPKNGLVGWWPFNGNANDESGNNNHGTVIGATLTLDRNGKANSAYSFDGVKSSNISFNNLIVKNEFTISIWAKATRTSGSSYKESNLCYPSSSSILSQQNWLLLPPHGGNGVSLGVGIAFGTDKIIVAEHCSNLLVPRAISEVNRLDYSHILLKYNATTFELYVDNKKIISKSVNCSNVPKILGNTFGTLYYSPEFSGVIDDIVIYNRALTEQEISQLYSGCSKETATSNNFNSFVFTNNSTINLNATPAGGTFNGEAVTNNTFNPSKAKLGKNNIKYTFKNSLGCLDSTNFTMIMVDSIGNTCSTYDTLKIKVKLTTGIKTGQFTSMNVYPNPTSDVLIIETNDVDGLKGYTYKIVDLQGKEIYKSLITASKTEIALKSIGPKGIYILHIIDEVGQTIENKKIILE